MRKIHPAEYVLTFCGSLLGGILVAKFSGFPIVWITAIGIFIHAAWYYRNRSILLVVSCWIILWFGRYAWSEHVWYSDRRNLFWTSIEKPHSGTWTVIHTEETPYGGIILWIAIIDGKNRYVVKSTDKNPANSWDTYFYEWTLIKSNNTRLIGEEMRNWISGTFIVRKKQKIKFGKPSNYESGRNYVKLSLRERMERALPKPESGLLAGMLVWDGQAMSKEQKSLFRETGLSHLIVASGSNVAILFWGMSIWYKRRTKWTKRIVVPLLLLFVFILMWTDMPILRAGILTGALLIGKTFWKNVRTYVALMILAVVFWMHDPFTITDDASFQLSFLATSGVMTLTPHFERMAEKIRMAPKNDQLKDMLFWTLWATVSTFPVSLVSFGNFAGAGIFANLTVLWTVPFILFGGIATIVGQALNEAIGVWIGYIPFLALVFLEKSAQFYGWLGWYLKNVELTEWQSVITVTVITYWMVILAMKEVRHPDDQREITFFGLGTR